MTRGLVLAQAVIAVFFGTATDPNNAFPVASVTAATPQCDLAKVPENILPTQAPTHARWDDANPLRDCETPTPTLSGLTPTASGYRAALSLNGGLFGPFSTAFLMQTPTVIAGSPFRVQMTHDGLNTTAYRLILNGQAGPDVPFATAYAAGTVTVPSAGVSVGTHTVAVEAVGPGGTARSVALTFQGAAPPPTAGTNPRIVQP
jgi:hypothetical protein